RSHQDAGEWDDGFVLRPVRGPISAQHTIDRIVTEGEGTPHGGEESHWARFKRIEADLKSEPDVWPAGSNPQLAPSDAAGVTVVTDPAARAAMELFDRVYVAMLALLELYHRFTAALAPHQ